MKHLVYCVRGEQFSFDVYSAGKRLIVGNREEIWPCVSINNSPLKTEFRDISGDVE